MQYICLHDLIYHLQTGKYSVDDDNDSKEVEKNNEEGTVNTDDVAIEMVSDQTWDWVLELKL